MPFTDPILGRLIDGRYRVESSLGAGGFGVVYRATDERMRRSVVLKLPHARLLEEPAFRERFEREVAALAEYEHPHIVKVHEVGAVDGRPFAVMQYLSGGSLKDRLKKAGGRMSPAEVADWLSPIAEALDYLHRANVLHRDVKPHNILFDRSGYAFLADFGIVKILGSEQQALTSTGGTPGTPEYMAPEALMEEVKGPAYDQYALGVVVYEALSGALPHGRATDPLVYMGRKWRDPPKDLSVAMPSVPALAAAAVMRALEREPGKRHPTCRGLAAALAAGISEADPAASTSPSTHSQEPAPVRRAPVIVEPPLTVPSWAKVAAAQIAEAERLRIPVAFENPIGMRFVLVPSGTFIMGSPAGEKSRRSNEARHEVALSKPFYLSVHETTNGQYRCLKENHRSRASLDGDNQPVVKVSHEDAVAFLAWLNGQDRAHTYRLPTEAEWEYACRAGTATPFWFGETISTEQANYDGDYVYGKGAKGVYRKKTTDVGTFPANGWGLYDMHGNVWEWCSDWYGEYPAGRATDPVGPSSGTDRVLRGGSWLVSVGPLRSARRFFVPPGARGLRYGFRVAAAAAPR